MPKIIGCTKEELLALNPKDFRDKAITAEEFIYIADQLGAFWRYDYLAAGAGRPGKHALLKSLLHSDGFFISKIMLEPPNIRKIMAAQMVRAYEWAGCVRPMRVCGIPDGAVELGKDVIRLLNLPDACEVEMKKVSGKITLISKVFPGDTILMVEDFCTKGTGFKEAVAEVLSKQPQAKILPYEMVMLNRGGLEAIKVPGSGNFLVIPIVTHRIDEWEADVCPLCLRFGSKAIKPKETEASWRDITTSQLPSQLSASVAEAKRAGETSRFLSGMEP